MICNMQDGCQNEPIISYVWPWGEQGCACATHAPLLQQLEKNTKRKVQVASITPGAPTPITRDERTAAAAKRIALEEENAELRARGVELYKANQDLTQQLRTARAQMAVTAEQADKAAFHQSELQGEVLTLRGELGKMVEQLQRGEVERRQLDYANDRIAELEGELKRIVDAAGRLPDLPG